ncbi:MAG: SAM-dependent chlorinase/fluorinase, partial [Chitinophagales bacterium]
MALVTLTTDYGLSDHFVGALKGQLLSQCIGIQLIDISHTVKNHDNIAAA